jgi:D-beta-D-heptose 7-phosphate kinase/D-beta-D-heptose 1-phosphate adenosyltransferase
MKTDFAPAIAGLEALIPKFRKIRIAVVGDLMLDRYLCGSASRLSPEAPVSVVDFESQSDFLGGAGNVAANLAALGARVQLYGVVGGQTGAAKKVRGDQAGLALRACLQRNRIPDENVLADPRRITTVKTRVIARHQQVVRIDHEQRDPLQPEIEELLFRRLVGSLRKIDALLLSDYDKGLISDSFAERVSHACHKFKIPVFVKPKTSRLLAYRGARAVVCNAKEAGTYVNRELNDEKAIEEAGCALLARFGCAAVIITRREKGMSIFEESSPRTLNIPATSFEVTYARVGQPAIDTSATGRQVFDVTGAGDTVLSVLAVAVTAGGNFADAAFLANVAAGVVVRKLGTATVSPEELAAALDEVHTANRI